MRDQVFNRKTYTESPCDVVANVVDCDLVVSEFELQSRYYVNFRTNTFGKGMNFLFHHLPNSTANILLQGWFLHQITHKVWYAIKLRSQTKQKTYI